MTTSQVYHSTDSFDKLKPKNRRHENKEALKLYDQLQHDGARHSVPVILAALKSCSVSRDIETGMKIHANVVSGSRFHTNIYILNSLLDLYSKCGSMVDAQLVFDRMPVHTIVSWNTIIKGYTHSGKGSLALDLFSSMQQQGCQPNSRSFVAAIGAVTSLLAAEGNDEAENKLNCLEKGMALHSSACKAGYDLDMFVASSLVDLYAKSGSMEDSRRLFDRMKSRDVVSWTALISGYVQSGQAKLALQLLHRMQEQGCQPNALTYGAALNACTKLAMEDEEQDGKSKLVYLEKGRELHSRLAKCGYEADAFVASSLMDMYSNCGSIREARQVFGRTKNHDVVAWNTIIMGHAQNGDGEMALELFYQMQREAGLPPNARTFVAAINACAALASKEKEAGGKKVSSLERGAAIHSQAMESGCCLDIFVANSLIDMYSKCGSLEEARRVFDGMEQRNIVSWTSMIMGYAENNAATFALELYELAGSYLQPNAQTFMAALKACGDLAAVDAGKRLHSQIRERNLDSNPLLACSLIGFYGKCGDTAAAREVFHSVARKDAAVWSALIAAYSFQGDAAGALNLLERMREEKIRPDGVTLLSVLKACSHAGLVDAGLECFREISSPTIEHYTCVVDLLSRANRLKQAVAVAERLAAQKRSLPAAVWMTILAASAKWKDVDNGRLAFEKLRAMDREEASIYIAMANVYSSELASHDSDVAAGVPTVG
ncbi:pentatricopeptide repeat-containing protein At1g11290, chloroplastic-like [Selaginella moellendorffii]|uniref:pentatricopeptide repeat-containing protein At1g11290, chloroplastic-like n=1 Tax=Selaginella moellendorffii TaxID=88036 RepID=UPI000D1C7060|nr:pentatricopeptide repeat-containing protein At1g11290, chloroplastic-like [Selaginella moellendorffii]XP_024522711.1 pentatricopeptide repeat-containing protein At1g11290, chloroplastic-like [Selaginella moellendorffii]|eukprot:XP_024522710.1 pentatricopeptide repeat-containing protein At1g11290, chloroplastic-like [Selaginella moellendorffii]